MTEGGYIENINLVISNKVMYFPVKWFVLSFLICRPPAGFTANTHTVPSRQKQQ